MHVVLRGVKRFAHRLILAAEPNRQIGWLPVKLRPFCGVFEARRLWRIPYVWELPGPFIVRGEVGVCCGAQISFDSRVVLFEILGRDFAGPAMVIRVALFPSQHIRVDQRTAPYAAGHHCLKAPERPEIEQTVQPLARIPEVCGHLQGSTGKASRRVQAAPFQYQYILPVLGQGRGCYPAAEPRTDHDVIVAFAIYRHIEQGIVVGHLLPLLQQLNRCPQDAKRHRNPRPRTVITILYSAGAEVTCLEADACRRGSRS